ncbi:MAG: class II glutamine amidotransferase [Proteobacteria bacterium]|nr:class II glutamine amidotransferase [Pseudomonadota bacterium]
MARVVHSHCIIAHVRAATPVTQLNCHPFSWGRFTFAHNGEVGGFDSIRRHLSYAGSVRLRRYRAGRIGTTQS